MHSHRLENRYIVLLLGSNGNSRNTVLQLFSQLLVLLELASDPLLDGDVRLEVFNDFLYRVSGVEHPAQETF